MGEIAMELMGRRAADRKAFGKPIAQHGAFASEFANCRIELTAARLCVLDAANALDRCGNKKVGPSTPVPDLSRRKLIKEPLFRL